MARSRLQSRLVNGSTGDPAVYVEIEGARRSLLLDCGDLGPLTSSELLRVSDCFVSHAHLDHFFGFDRLLRANIGSVRTIRVFGPEGMIDRVGGRLTGYQWNLYDELGLAFEVTEVAPGGFRVQSFQVRERFVPAAEPSPRPASPTLLEDPDVSIGWTLVDHGTPCLAFSVSEPAFFNVDEDALAASDLARGPWLRVLKEMVASGADPSSPIDTPAGRVPFGELAERLVVRTQGRKLAYVTDTAFTGATRASIVGLARGADLLFCEHYYLEADRVLAERNRHLTARQAGTLAREAGAKDLVPFHHAPKYAGRYEDVVEEGRAAFEGREVST